MSEYESKAKIEQLIETPTSHGQEPILKKRRMKLTNIPLLIILFVIICIGIIILYSVSSPIGYAEQQDSLFYVKKQIRFTLIGLAMAVFVNFVDPLKLLLRKHILLALGSYGLALGLAAITLVAGQTYNGARRWFIIAGFQFQPSEVVKVLLVVSLAAYRQFVVNLKEKANASGEPKKMKPVREAMLDFVIPISCAVVVDALILAEPHGSCALIIAAIVFISTLASGIRLRSWIVGILILLGFVIVIGGPAYMLMPEEQVTKIEQKVLGNFSHVFNYIDEAQNDYIFSVYVEETGFVGGMFLIILYMIMLVMCMMVVWNTTSVYYRVVAAGCTAHIFVEAFMNIAVELQIIPSTGVTLPFISYGGSAQIFLLLSFGFILGCSRYGTLGEDKEKLKEKTA